MYTKPSALEFWCLYFPTAGYKVNSYVDKDLSAIIIHEVYLGSLVGREYSEGLMDAILVQSHCVGD